MFDNLKGMAGLAGIMKDLPRIKARMEEAKAKLADLRASASTGGGAVTATANGKMRLVSIDIDRALIAGLVDASDPADREMAQDLVIGAVNAALEKAQELAAQELAGAAEELGLPIPPGALEGLV
jgi:DNA-binding YbaB/EbfC family protein